MTDDSQTDKWVVGPEYDGPNFRRLDAALRSLGYLQIDSTWGLCGSQELRKWEVQGPNGALSIEAETYMGLTVVGPSALIAALRRAFDSPAQANQ